MIPRAKLEDINETDIKRLVADEVREGRTLDFKETLDLSRDGRQALVEDVCAFANTVGGDLVFGLTAPDGTAGEIRPVVVDNLDDELLKLTNFLRDATEPRVSAALLHRAVPLATGGHVVVLRVAASPNAPHRVIRSGQFYMRNSVGKEPMDIHAIRTAFGHAAGLGERARAFRDSRLAALRERRAQIPVPPGPLLAVHLIPVQSLTRPDQYAIEALAAAAAHLENADPAGHELRWPRPNLEGVICFSENDEHMQHSAFAQVFRDGCIELVGMPETFSFIPHQVVLYPTAYERHLVRAGLPAAIAALNALEVTAPIYLSVSLLNVRNLHVEAGAGQPEGYFPQLPSHVADIVSPLVYVEDLSRPAQEILSPALDSLWNAVGFSHSQTDFDKNGQ